MLRQPQRRGCLYVVLGSGQPPCRSFGGTPCRSCRGTPCHSCRGTPFFGGASQSLWVPSTVLTTRRKESAESKIPLCHSADSLLPALQDRLPLGSSRCIVRSQRNHRVRARLGRSAPAARVAIDDDASIRSPFACSSSISDSEDRPSPNGHAPTGERGLA
jgi:hypothetical protein